MDSQPFCLFCSAVESMDHVDIGCGSLHSLFSYPKDLFWLHFSPMPLIFGHLVWRRAGRSEDFLTGLLLGLAKLVINRFRQWAMEGVIIANCPPLFRGYVRARVSLEKGHAACTGALDTFRESHTCPRKKKKVRTVLTKKSCYLNCHLQSLAQKLTLHIA
eukprot:g33446.t1